MHFVELVEVSASCVERFACFKGFFNVRPDLGQGVVKTQVFSALAEIIKRFYVSAPGRLLKTSAWLDAVARDVNENVLGDQA